MKCNHSSNALALLTATVFFFDRTALPNASANANINHNLQSQQDNQIHDQQYHNQDHYNEEDMDGMCIQTKCNSSSPPTPSSAVWNPEKALNNGIMQGELTMSSINHVTFSQNNN
eukprot:158426-Ditylum_brightwellii.AAC.1